MIARLRGVVESRGDDWVILDVQGVGYITYCSGRTLARLPGPGGTVALHVETHVREGAITLYGFLDQAEWDWFRLLTTVQGVGAKVALRLLSVLAPDQLARALAAQDTAVLTRAIGVGPRLAARLLTELKDKVADLATAEAGGEETFLVPRSAAASDAVSALVNLGYGRAEALAMVAQAETRLMRDGPPEVGALVRTALQDSARKDGD